MNIKTDTQNIMRLLCQVVLVDGHIHASEIAAFIEGVKDLALTDAAGTPLSGPQIRDWFIGYKDELNTTWSTHPKDVALTHLILSLAEWPNKQAVIDVLERISIADAEFHKEEKTLISIVQAYWQFEGLDAPGARIEG
jgi:hypothetical protein